MERGPGPLTRRLVRPAAPVGAEVSLGNPQGHKADAEGGWARPAGAALFPLPPSRLLAEDIKDVSKHCYLALSFAPTVSGSPHREPWRAELPSCRSGWARANQ